MASISSLLRREMQRERERVESSLDGTRSKHHHLVPSRADPHLEHSLPTKSKEPQWAYRKPSRQQDTSGLEKG